MPPLPTESIGWPVTCREDINRFLSDLSEYDKLGFAAGTTIQALIPLLISVWGLPTADIRELLLMRERLVAILSAGLTFGLPVRQKRAFPHLEPRDLDRDFLQQIGHRKPSVSPRRSFARLGLFARLIFCSLQAFTCAVAMVLNHRVVQDVAQPLWSCTHSSVVWHAGFLVTIPVVGLVWCFALSLTLHSSSHGRLVLYRTTKGWKHPMVLLFPGLLQGLLTLFYTFMLTTLYATSIKSALIRSAVTATLIFCSRAFSIVYANLLSTRKPRALFHCEDERVRSEVIRRYEELEEELRRELENAALAMVPVNSNGTAATAPTATAPTATAPTSTLPLQP